MWRSPKPIPFLSGLVIGLIVLSLLGSVVVPRGLVDGFQRFYFRNDASTNFFPTPRLLDEIVKTQDEPDAILVIVGGSSVLNGIGQPLEHLWTDTLQKELGPRFVVINFAMTGGRASDFGIIPAEYMLKQNRKVIYIADSNINFFTTLYDDSRYNRTLTSAWFRGYLLPWQKRDEYIWNEGPKKYTVPFLGSIFDALFNFYDLWNWVQYNYVSLIWDSDGFGSMKPRRVYRDQQPPVEFIHEQFYKANHDSDLGVERDQVYPDGAAGLERYMYPVDVTMPPALRAVSIAVVRIENPFLRNMLAPDTQAAIVSQAEAVVARLEQSGFGRALVADSDFVADDYADRLHMVPSGGDKLAKVLAPEVVTLSKKLGYLP